MNQPLDPLTAALRQAAARKAALVESLTGRAPREANGLAGGVRLADRSRTLHLSRSRPRVFVVLREVVEDLIPRSF